MAKKRANGEGNIRKRKDGRWEGRYTAGHDPVTGKQIFKNVLGKTQNEVKEKLKKALIEAGQVDFTKTGQYTVGTWMDTWFENVAKIKVRPSSHQTYKGYIDNHIKPNIGKIPLEKLTTMDLQKFYRKLLTKGRVERIEAQEQPKGLSAKTVRNINQVISSATRYGFSALHSIPADHLHGKAYWPYRKQVPAPAIVPGSTCSPPLQTGRYNPAAWFQSTLGYSSPGPSPPPGKNTSPTASEPLLFPVFGKSARRSGH